MNDITTRAREMTAALCAALEVAEAERDALRAEMLRHMRERDALRAEVKRLRARVKAVGRVLSENGCDCECECVAGEHDDDCDRCLACRVEDAIARREDVVVEGEK